VRAVGIDPGSNTGVVAVELPDTGQLARGRWIDSAVLHPTDIPGVVGPARDAAFCDRIADWLRTIKPNLVVLEEPVDARSYWGGARKKFDQAGTGSSFRSGVYYGVAVAATLWMPRPLELASYPVGNFEKRLGWMGGGTNRRDKAIGRSATLARHLGAPAEVFALKPDGSYRHDHLFMALGVLAFHLSQLPLRPLATRAS